MFKKIKDTKFFYATYELVKEKKVLMFDEEDDWVTLENDFLNRRGEEGLELVSTNRITNNLEPHQEFKIQYYFKQEIK